MGSMMGSMGRMGSMTATSDVARFRFRQGDSGMDVRCPSTETLQDCVRAASQLLARFSRMRSGAPRSEEQATGSPISPASGYRDVTDVLKESAHYEATAWLFTMQRIGQDLRSRYEPAKDLPPELLTLVEQTDKKSEASGGGSDPPA